MATELALEPAAGSDPPATVFYGGFWRRVGAFVVDTLMLGALGLLLGLVFADTFARLGEAGRLVGLVLAGAYLIPSYGAPLNGQSVGKRLLGLRVVGAGGRPASALRATARYLALAVPALLNGAYFTVATPVWLTWLLGVVLVTIVFGALLGNAYLLLFNRPSRRLLHDLAAGTIVVRARAEGVAELTPLRPVHAIALLAVPVVVLCGAALLGKLATGYAPELAQLQRVQSAIAGLPQVVEVGVDDSTQTTNGTVVRVLELRVRVARWPATPEALANDCFARAQQAFPGLEARDRVAVTLLFGFDIGIASKWQGTTFAHAPKEWRERIATPN